MKGKILLSLGLVLLFLFSTIDAEAQRRNKYRKRKNKNKSISRYHGGAVGGKFRPYSFLSGNVNALNYYGDLAPVNKAASTDISFTQPGFGVNVGYKFSPYAAVRAGFNYGRLKGDDISSDPAETQAYSRYLRNLSFRNDIKEFHMGFEIFLLPNHGGPNVRPPFNVYLFLGGAVFHHEPKGLVPDMDYTTGGTEVAPSAGEWVKLRKLGTEGQFLDGSDVKKYSPFQLSIPLAIGATFRLPGPFDVGLELGYRYLFTDYVDDVSTNYLPFDQFDDPLARIMSDRSAEPVAAWSGIDRSGVKVASGTMSDGNTYYAAGDVGGGLVTSGDAIRGNPKDNDMMFMTTLKLIWIVGKTGSSAKFR